MPSQPPLVRGVLQVAAAAALAIVLGAAAPAQAATTFTVTTTADGTDARLGDGVCRTSSGMCTLRAAVQESNLNLTAHTIVVPAGRFTLTRPITWPLPSQTADLEFDPANGDLDVYGTLTIRGAGADRTTIDAKGNDRAFNVEPTGALSLSGLTITGGDATKNDRTPIDIALGGAILTTGKLSLTGVALVGNKADGGGGVFGTPFTTMTIQDSLVANNSAVEGGGLRLDGGATITNTTITGNSLFVREFGKHIPDEITGYGGGIDHRGSGNVVIVNSTFTNNRAVKAGGGYNSGQGYTPIKALTPLFPYRTYLLNTVIAGNTVGAKRDNCHVAAMVIQSRGSNLADDSSCFLTSTGDLPDRDPKLGALSDNGGPTFTQAPRSGSPLIDHGSNAGCPDTDQRGVVRPQGLRCDIGAVEVADRNGPDRLQ